MGGSTTSTTIHHCKKDVTNLLLLTLFSVLSIIYLYLLLPNYFNGINSIYDTIHIKLLKTTTTTVRDDNNSRNEYTNTDKEWYYVKLSEDMGLKLEQDDIDAPYYYY